MKIKAVYLLSMLLNLNLWAQETTGSFKDDRDGKSYKTISIDGKTWMAENLAFKKGDCFAENDDPLYRVQYGFLYLYKTALKACPEGWHLPNDEEWALIEIALGGKEGRQNLNTKAKVLFNQLGGFKSQNTFINVGASGRWWSSTKDKMHSGKTETDYWVRENNPKDLGFSRTYSNELDACSVRCVKD